MKLSLILICLIPALAFSQELKFDGWENWEKDLNLRYYDLGNCFCPWLIKDDSSSNTQTWDKMNYSPYIYDKAKPLIIKLDSVKDKELIRMLLDRPKFTLPKPEEKKKPTT